GLTRRQVALQLLQVQPHRARALGAPRLHADRQLAALEAALRAFPRRPLQALEPRRPAEADLQVAAIHAARLHRPAPGAERAFRPPEPGHPAQRQAPNSPPRSRLATKNTK